MMSNNTISGALANAPHGNSSEEMVIANRVACIALSVITTVICAA